MHIKELLENQFHDNNLNEDIATMINISDIIIIWTLTKQKKKKQKRTKRTLVQWGTLGKRIFQYYTSD